MNLRTIEAWFWMGGLGVVLLTVAWSPVYNDLKGVQGGWWLLCLMAAVALAALMMGRLLNSQRPGARADPSLEQAARVWLVVCVLAFALQWVARLYWGEGWRLRQFDTRMLAMAAVAYVMVWALPHLKWVKPAFVVACLLMGAVAIQAALDYSVRLIPFVTNPINWAGGIAVFAAAAWPLGLMSRLGAMRLLAVVTAGAMLGAVVLSGVRGALGLLPWCLLVLGVWWFAWRGERVSATKMFKVAALGLALLGVLAWFAPQVWQVPLSRIALALTEVNTYMAGGDQDVGVINTSMGSRLYMWTHGTLLFVENPLWGLGAKGVREMIVLWSEQTGSVTLSGLGHLHNQYIYSAAAYGLWGLASWLLYVGGLVALFVKLKHTHTPVAWGFLGVACMLMLQGLTNVNLAHNHYGVMVSMAVCLLFVVAKTSGNTARGAGKP